MALTDLNATRTRFTARPAPQRFSLRTLLSVWRSRRALARLDSRALADIGVSPQNARIEAAKPVWDVPATWRN